MILGGGLVNDLRGGLINDLRGDLAGGLKGDLIEADSAVCRLSVEAELWRV